MIFRTIHFSFQKQQYILKVILNANAKYKRISLIYDSQEEQGVLRSPLGIPPSFLETFLSKHIEWLQKHHIAHKKGALTTPSRVKHKQFVPNTTFCFLGESLLIQHSLKARSIRQRIEVQKNSKTGQLLVCAPLEGMHTVVYQWMRFEFANFLQEYCSTLCKRLKITFNKITVKDVKTKWGSCSNKRNLNFNWRISMAPLFVIEYLCMHEVCHLIHLNHSQDFWDLLASINPQYQKAEEWLKLNGADLYAFG